MGRKNKSGKAKVVVDGNNVAYTEVGGEGKKPKLQHIIDVKRKLESMGYDPVVLVDAALKYEIDKEDQFRELLQDEKIRQVPANTDADYFILKLAKEFDGKILSNDQYEEYREEYNDVLYKQVNFMIVENEIVFKGLRN